MEVLKNAKKNLQTNSNNNSWDNEILLKQIDEELERFRNKQF